MHILFVALGTARQQQLTRDIRFVLEHGGAATLLTNKGSTWSSLPEATQVHELARAEARHWVIRSERLLVFRLPDLVFRGLRKAIVVLSRILPVPAATRDRLLRRIESARLRVRKVGVSFHKKTFGRFYRHLRPYVLWKAAQSEVIKNYRMRDIDMVVVADALATPIGWHLAKANPELPVAFSLDRDAVAERLAPDAA